jgi:hypothetical protein
MIRRLIILLLIVGCDLLQEEDVRGCTNPMACNFNPDANILDNSCIDIPDGNCDCNGNVEDDCGVCGGNNLDKDDCGVCGGNTIEECGSCEYVFLWGDCYNIETTTTLNPYNSQTSGQVIPPEIGKLINLSVIDLINNDLIGEIPLEIGNLISLTYLNLYSNQLTGEIPPEIGKLTNLWYLELQKNQLTGQIPSEIGNLVNLIILHLNNNNLSGELPGNICDLTIDWSGGHDLIHEMPLQYFDVDNNNLCPPYPDCLINQEPFSDVNNNGIWDYGEAFEDINESGFYDENQIGYQNTSSCP